MDMDSIISKTYAIFFILVMFFALSSCTDEDVIGALDIIENEIILQATGEPVKVEVKSNSEWRIDFPETDWLSTDIRGGQPDRNYFMVTYNENINDSERYCDITVFTKDGKSEDVIKIKQLSRYPFITSDYDALDLFTMAGEYSVELNTNVPVTDIEVSATVDWVKNFRIDEGILYFNTETNSQALRSGIITIYFKDQYDREVNTEIEVSQAFSEYADATPVSFSTVSGYTAGTKIGSVSVEGFVVANGTSANLPGNRYILQNEAGETVLFESENLIALPRFNKIILSLEDGVVQEESEGSFSYKVITGITSTHVLNSEASSFTIPEITIKELTNEMAFSLVSLKDIEITIPEGAFTNFKTTDPGAADRRNDNYYWVKQFPAYYRYFPLSIRDKQGNNTYMLTSLHASYAHETVPKGSGTITGIVTRVSLSNFDISESQLCITPLTRGDIDIAQTNQITNVLVEWDCAWDPSWPSGYTFTEYHPTGGEASQSNAILNKDNNQLFQRTYADNRLGFQDSFAGNVNLTATNGNFGRVSAGAFNSRPWSANAYFYVDQISTVGITTPLSLQIEMNLSWNGGYVMQVEYATSMSGPWTVVEGSEFIALGQFDRSSAGGQTDVKIPGYKIYDIKLPDVLQNQENISIKIKPIALAKGATSYAPVRLGHLSIKYNK